MLLGIKKRLKGLGYLALALWLAGCILFGYVGIQIADDFSKKGVAKKSVAIPNPPGNTLYLAVAGDEYDDSDYDSKIVFGDWNCYFNDDQEINFGQTRLQIEKSETDSFEIKMIYSARGKSRKEAVKRAENINYGFSQKDSLLQFNPYFMIPDGEKWRDQKVQILVKVPIGAGVYLTRGMERIIFDVDNVSGTSDRNMVGKTWTMLDNGLNCAE